MHSMPAGPGVAGRAAAVWKQQGLHSQADGERAQAARDRRANGAANHHLRLRHAGARQGARVGHAWDW